MSELNVPRTAPASGGARTTGPGKAQELPAAARLVAVQPHAPAYSPVVVAGFVRIFEFGLMAAIGAAVYFTYVVPADGFDWYYPLTVLGIAAFAMLGFQAADIYHVQAFRSVASECTRLLIAWSLLFLLVAAIAFFARLGGFYSRVWLGGYYAVGLIASRRSVASRTATFASLGCSTIAARIALPRCAPASKSSAPWMIWSSLPASPASIW